MAKKTKSKDQSKSQKDKSSKDQKPKEVEEDVTPPDEGNMSAFQIKERKLRTSFVGNVPIQTTAKNLRSKFEKFGTVEKIWFKACQSKNPEFEKDNKTAFVLFKTLEEAKKAQSELNQTTIGDKSIRVVSDSKDALYKEGNDFESTILVGNLPFSCTENELINHFRDVSKLSSSGDASSANSGILNVKIVRD